MVLTFPTTSKDKCYSLCCYVTKLDKQRRVRQKEKFGLAVLNVKLVDDVWQSKKTLGCTKRLVIRCSPSPLNFYLSLIRFDR